MNGAKAQSAVQRPLNGADAVAHALKAAGVARVFALCGDHVNTLFHAVHRAGIAIVGTRHESAAVQMADGAARATGQPGVAIVTGGPGHTNAVTGAAVAQGAQSPVVIISGQAPKARRDRGGNQSLHQADIMRPVTKWAFEAESSAGLGELTWRALAAAVSGTPGAVSLSIPVDLADGAIEQMEGALPAQAVAAGGAAGERDIALAVELLSSAQRPVMVIGGSAHQHAPHAALASAAKALGIPVFTNGHARGVVGDDGELCFGHASPLFNDMFRAASEADVWLVAGTTVDYNIASVVPAAARVIQIHSDARQLGVGRLPDVAICASTAAALAALAASPALDASAWGGWRATLQARHREQRDYWASICRPPGAAAAGVHPAQLCAVLQPLHTPETTLVVDVGDFVNWPKAYFPAARPTRYMDGGTLGNLGGAVPIAIGAAMARPADPVWAFSGDGGFGFHAWELSLAVQQRLPITFVVGNDCAWGTEKRLQMNAHGSDLACDLPAIRYEAFARLLGVPAFRVSDARELAATIDAMRACTGPRLLEVELAPQAGRPYAKGKAA